MSFKCPKCEFTHTNLRSLRVHWLKQHMGSAIDLRVALFGRPTCECGCGEQTRFLTLERGFFRFRNGHNDRVHNNWGHNPVAKDKSRAVQKEMRARGEWKPNPYKGLTKETDGRLALRGERVKAAFTPEKSEKYSKQMKQHRLDGTIPTLSGSAHSQWKGGTSAISARCHGSSRLFREWKYPKLHTAGFKCRHCGKSEKLQVHHNGERMAEIIKQCNDRLNPAHIDDLDLATRVVEAVIDYHVSNDVSGEVICKPCHKLEHPSLNF